MSVPPTAISLGFLTCLHEPSGYLGGYLLTNGWGRPLEFRLTSAVQPNRVQSILYGSTLTDYIHADLIGRTLVEKASAQPTLIVTNEPAMLAVRSRLSIPVIGVTAEPDQPPPFGTLALTHARCRGLILYPETYADDRPVIEKHLAAIDDSVNLLEPFSRIKDAIAEARKMGVASRVAA